ncbi:MAG: MBL fold metallo-hydrolase [Methylococcaceae bacterium]
MRKAAEGIINKNIQICGHPTYPAYLVKGDRASALIEAGLNLIGPSYLRGINQILGDCSLLNYILVTHGHYDHLGAISYLKKMIPEAKLMGHESLAILLQKQKVLDTMNFLSEQTWAYFEDIKKNLLEKDNILIRPVTWDKGLKEGDTIELGNLNCHVYETPGHTKDHLSFFIPEEGILFAGEALGNAIIENENEMKAEFLTSYTDYLQSIEKLMKLSPKVKIIAMSHLYYYTDDDVQKVMDLAYKDTICYRHLIEKYLDMENGNVEAAIQTMVRTEYDEKGNVYQERNAYMTNVNAQVKAIAALAGK